MTLQKFIVYAVVILRMMFFDIVCFYSFLMMTIVLINTSNGLSVPAGLRPAKKVGDPREQIVPGKEQQQQREQQQQQQQQQQQLQEEEQQQQQQHDEVSNLRPTPKVPPNLSIRSRMMAALSASPVEPNKEKNSSKVEDLGKNNYGLNTVLQTNLVDSHGRIMKNVNSVPIKVPSSAEMKNARTRHTARQVESDADKVVPIKFGSTSRRR
ncbi:Reticulocyte-binding protein [Dirofilaria immitis]